MAVEVNKDDNFVNIMNYKRTATSDKISEGMPKGFAKIIDYIRGLRAANTHGTLYPEHKNSNYLDIPDYDYIRY